MNLVLLFDRAVRKINRSYNKYIFKKRIRCDHSDFYLVGNVTLINSNIKLGHNVTIYPDVMFFGDGLIEIGDNVDIGNGTIIYASKSGGVHIGNNTMIAAQCYIIDTDHGISAGELIRNQPNTVSPVFIGEDVLIAAGVKVLKGTTLENGSIVGAGAVVKGGVNAYDIVAGVPARKIGMRI